MKAMKKILALALVAVMMMALGAVAASAEDPEGSITVTNQVHPEGIDPFVSELYRIFDVAANDDYSSLAYTINSDWTGFFAAGAKGAAYIVDTNDETANNGNGYTPIIVDGVKKYIALTDSNVAAFGLAALEYSQQTPVSPVASNTTGVFTGLELGYYMVYPRGANENIDGYTSIVSLTTTKPDATVVQKATASTIIKTDDDDSVEVGQVVNYTLTGVVPNTTGFETYVYRLNDQMTKGLTFNPDSITVKIGSVTVPKTSSDGTHYVYSEKAPDTGYETAFSIEIPVMKYQDHVGETITVTYTATVNSDAVTKIDKNHATLSYTRSPGEDVVTTPPTDTIVYSAQIVINKFDATNTTAKLQDAKFVLRCKSVTDTGAAAKAEPGKYFKVDNDGNVSWVAETGVDAKVSAGAAALESDIVNGATVVTTGPDGIASFDGLENGEYELIEVAAPAGYNQIKGVAATVTIAGSDADPTSLTVTVDVPNNSGSELPSTGGVGTTLFYVFGSLMVLGALVFFITKRRMNAAE